MIKLDEALAGIKTVAIAGHTNPDGDCIGSCLGLYNYISDNYKDVSVEVFLEPFSSKFDFLEGADKILHDVTKAKEYDVFFALDCGDTMRLGEAASLLPCAKKTICIDHHVSNRGYADVNYLVPDASSTSELVYTTLCREKIGLKCAEALYLGIVHDTGVFKYSCTGKQTMQIAGELISIGVPFTDIIDRTFYERTYEQSQILGRTMLESMLILDKKCIVSYVKKNMMDFYGVRKQDLDGIVSQLNLTKGVECAIFLYEIEPNTFKVSMRSKNYVDVSRIAVVFGGGGHVRAAGCTMNGSAYDVINNLSRYFEEQLKESSFL